MFNLFRRKPDFEFAFTKAQQELKALKEDYSRLTNINLELAKANTDLKNDNSRLCKINSELKGVIEKLTEEKRQVEEDHAHLQHEQDKRNELNRRFREAVSELFGTLGKVIDEIDSQREGLDPCVNQVIP